MSERVIHEQVANDIGVSTPFVSRLRNGFKHPSGWTVLKIHTVYDWPPSEQRAALDAGTWAEQFERVITAHYAKGEARVE